MNGSFILTPELADEAFDLVRPAIEGAMTRGVLKRTDMNIVLMNPGIRPHQVADPMEAILREWALGNKSTWEYDYQRISRAKTFATWRTGLPTNLLIHAYPHLLEGNEDWSDSKYFGSVFLDGIPAGASGAQAFFDEWVGNLVAATCKALCLREMKEKYLKDDAPDFLAQVLRMP